MSTALATATAPALIKTIRQLRKQFPNLGKAKLQVLLQPWCQQQDIALPSASTLGRIIARDPNKMRHVPTRLSARGRHKPLNRNHKTRHPKGGKHPPLEVFAVAIPWCACAMDCAATCRLHRSAFPLRIDIKAATPSSQQAAIALDARCQRLPKPPRFILLR